MTRAATLDGTADKYRLAAKMCEERAADCELSCRAIANAFYGKDWSDRQWDLAVNPYVRLMSPEGGTWDKCPAWLKTADMDGVDREDWRVLALCFMAAIVEAGDA